MEYFLDSRKQLGFVVAVFFGFFIKKRFFPSKKTEKWKAPFTNDSRLPVSALEINQEKRGEILKKVFNAEIATKQEWDAIVIGSGIGGLSAAAVLSKAGMKVLVLEKHGKCGGACHIFRAEGYEFDVGIHYIGEFNRRTLVRTLLEQISDGQIEWASLDTIFDTLVVEAGTPRQRQYSIPSGKGVWKKQLLEQFPAETKAIETFFQMVDRVSSGTKAFVIVKILPIWLVRWCNRFGLLKLFSDFFSLSNRRLKDVVEGLTSNPDLQLLFTYSWGTYATPPSQSSFALQALLHGHYEQGASYPIGGASEIPYRIVPIIQRAGGQVMMKAEVTEIITANGKVTGVRVGKKGGKSVDIHAPVVVSDAGIYNTFVKLLPEDVATTSPTWPLACNYKPGIGCFSVFVGLKGTSEELGLSAQNVWAFSGNHSEKDFEAFTQSSLEDVLDKPYPFYFIGFPSAKDPSWDGRYPGRSTITIVSFAPYSWFEQWTELAVKKRGDEYNSLKNALGQQLIDQVVQIYPQLKNAVDYFCVGTPITNEHYLNTHQGAIYGLDHLQERFHPVQASLLRPKTEIDGLFLSGQDVMSCGFVPSLMSGLLAASCVLDKNLVLELAKLHKQLKNDSSKEKSK